MNRLPLDADGVDIKRLLEQTVSKEQTDSKQTEI
jgi:hypothetical protein